MTTVKITILPQRRLQTITALVFHQNFHQTMKNERRQNTSTSLGCMVRFALSGNVSVPTNCSLHAGVHVPVNCMGSDVESHHGNWTKRDSSPAYKRPAAISLAGRGVGRCTGLIDHVAEGVQVKTLRSRTEHDVPSVWRP